MEIKKMLLTVNKYSRPGTSIKLVNGVVVHYVGNAGSSATGNRNYFESLKTGKKDAQGNLIYASSQYIIGLDGEIIQCVPENEVAYCSNNRNSDTISIECCHPLADGKFTDATYKGLIALVADICTRYSLNPLRDVIRHHDVTGKACPLFHVNNPAVWDGLRKDVQIAMTGGKLPEVGYVNLRYHTNTAEIRADNVNGNYMAKLSELARVLGDIKLPIRGLLEWAGLEVGWDQNTKTITAAVDELPVAAADFEILCRITQAEAGGEDAKGRMLVVNVIMNRVKGRSFPNSIKDVVFQESQFEPTRNGAYDKAIVSESTKVAVAAALHGEDHSQGATYFRTTNGATPDCWHERALTALFSHGGHRFYM